MAQLFDTIVHYALLPSDTGEMTVYYLIWIGGFVIFNVIWDIFTPRTGSFHLDKLKDKGDVLYNAATFCSSILILSGLISPTVRQLAKDTTLPLVLAACSGVIRSIPALCPYKPGQGA